MKSFIPLQQWCRWWDLNPHPVARNGFWVRRVCLFHHTGILSFNGASDGSRTHVVCLEGRSNSRYTTPAYGAHDGTWTHTRVLSLPPQDSVSAYSTTCAYETKNSIIKQHLTSAHLHGRGLFFDFRVYISIYLDFLVMVPLTGLEPVRGRPHRIFVPHLLMIS